MAIEILLCSNCFSNEGLRLDALQIGIKSAKPCPNCKSKKGNKLNRKLLETLSYRFFVLGTIQKLTFGSAPVIQFNETNKTGISVAEPLMSDVRLIEETIDIGFFYYGPRLWMLGEIEPLKSLQRKSERLNIINRIVSEFPQRIISKEEVFYRLRKNPDEPEKYTQYDTPPASVGGRLDSKNLPSLYGSQDLEVCIHECRVTVEDKLFVATLAPLRNLTLLDLTALLNEKVSEFESLDIAVSMLFEAGAYSYKILREIALAAEKAGFNGIIYPSYFSSVRTGTISNDNVFGISIRKIPTFDGYVKDKIIPNIALFGRPIADGTVTVNSINRIFLDRVAYGIHFGPVLY